MTRGLRVFRNAVLALLLVSSGAFAEQERPASLDALSLEDVTRSVETRFPLLQAAERDRALAAADVLSAEGGFDPAVKMRATTIPFGGYPNERFDVAFEQPTAAWGTRFFGGWRYGQGSFAPYDGKLETAEYGEGRIGAQVPLWRDGPIDRRRAAVQKAEIGTSAARLSIAEQKLLMVRAASMKYWDWVAAGRRLAVARDLLTMATTRDAQIKTRVDRGDLPAYERGENLRVMHQREAQVTAAERALDSVAIELSLYLRTDGGATIIPSRDRLPGALPTVSATLRPVGSGANESLALAQRPEPKRLEAMVDQARVDLRYAENQKKPGIDLFVMGSKDMGRGPPKITPAELEITVLVEIPLFNRVQEGRRRAAEAQIQKLSDQARFARDRVVAEVADATNAIDRARERAAAVRREVEVARTLIDAERERFELGDSTLLMVNLREQAYAEAELREVDALADQHRGVAALRAAVGQAGP